MAALRTVVILALTTLAGACAQAPVAEQSVAPPAPLPLVNSSGLVIGTLSYRYVEAGTSEEGPRWVVHVKRVDDPAQDYALPVDVDAKTRSGVFTGALPAGVYALSEASSSQARYAPSGAAVFEVQAGQVRDAGHYALNPVGGL